MFYHLCYWFNWSNYVTYVTLRTEFRASLVTLVWAAQLLCSYVHANLAVVVTVKLCVYSQLTTQVADLFISEEETNVGCAN